MTQFKLSRRKAFQLAGAGAGILAAPALMVRAATAQSADQTTGMAGRGFRRFPIGDFEITVIDDGGRVTEDPQATFGTNQSVDDVAALLEENFLPVESFRNSFSPTLVSTGSDLVLFDTGNGEAGRAGGTGQLLSVLQAAGYAPEDVTVVVLTHLHGDHINGLMEGGAPAFANARYVIGQVEYDFWSDSARMGTPAEGGHQAVTEKVVPLADRATFIGDGDEVVPGVTATAAFGHSPGHMIYRLESGGQQLVLTADTANHYVLSLQRPDWEVRFDMDKAAAAASRKAVFDMIASERIPFVGYHMPFPAVGFIEPLDTGYRFVPASYQFDV